MKFDFRTIKDFDNHINDSINGYNLLDDLILKLSSFFIKEDTVPIDLGCSSGRLIKRIEDEYKVSCIGYDSTDNLFIDDLNLIKTDITSKDFNLPNTSLVFMVFTLQFIDVKKRIDLLQKIYNALDKNGALIICEKEYSNDSFINECFTFSNYQYKRENFTEKEILDKESDLRRLMTPLNEYDNTRMFKEVGFNRVDTFFKSLNFKGYLCVK